MSSTSLTTTSTRKSLVKRIRTFSFFACFSTLSLFSLHTANAAGVAESKTELGTPTYGDGNSYQLVENTSGTFSSQNILKYVGNAETGELEAVYYDLTFDNVLGAAEGDGDIFHYKWVDQRYYQWDINNVNSATDDPLSIEIAESVSHDGKILVQTTDAAEADVSIRGTLRTQDTTHHNAANTTSGDSLNIHSASLIQQGTDVASTFVQSHLIEGVTLDALNISLVNSSGGKAATLGNRTHSNGSVTVGLPISGTTEKTDIKLIQGEFIGNVNWGANGPTDSETVSMPTLKPDGSVYGATLTGIYPHAGALSILSTSSQTTNIGDIKGIFAGNAGARGAGIYVSGAKSGSNYSTTIGNIEGDFFNNVATQGGAAIAVDGSKINSISGTFSGNTGMHTADYLFDTYWQAEKDFSGGAVFIRNSDIGSINGDFTNNTLLGADDPAAEIFRNASLGGGALTIQLSTVDSINGNFINNSADMASATAVLIDTSTVDYLAGNFYLNSGKLTGERFNGDAGAALHISYSTVNMVADKQNITFTGNSFTSANGSISNTGLKLDTSTVNMTTVDGNTIIINDIIYSPGDSTIHINNGKGVTTESANYGVVEFNNQVIQTTINVHAGTLRLGEFEATTFMGKELDSSYAMVLVSNINVSAGATIDAYSAYALAGEKYGSIPGGYSSNFSHNIITNSGTISMATGTLVNGITLKDGGALNLTGDVAISYDKSTLSATEAAKVVTVLSVEGTGNKITGNGTDNRVTGKINIAADSGLDISNVSISAHSVITNAAGYENSTVSNARVTEINLGSKQTSSVDSSALAGYKGDAGTLELHVFEMLNVGGADLTALTLEGNITFELALDAADQALLDSIMAKTQDGMFVFQYGEGADGTDGGLVFGDYDTLASMDNLNVILEINGESYQSQYTYTDGNNNYAFAFTAIPEPSTATLSLLALAGLLARRRRSVKTVA